MKRLWISLSLLCALFAAALGNSLYLSGFLTRLSAPLSQAQALAGQGQWAQCRQLCQQARQLWDSRALYLYSTLDHADIDAVSLLFLQYEGFLNAEDGGEYLSTGAALLGQLELLRSQESLCLQNIL